MTNFEGMCTRLFAHRFCQLTCLVYLSLALPAVALAQTSAPTTVPAPHSADAKEAINKGILAARQQDYPLAIRYFQDARKIAPDAPEIYFDLGLAESKIPGRELRAIAWFGAYLAANPNASNAAAVNDQILALDVKSRSDVIHLIKSIQDQDQEVPIPEVPGFPAFVQDIKANRLEEVAKLWASVGDFAAALKVANLIQENQHKSGYKSGTLSDIAEFQVKAGDIAGALKTSAAALKIANNISDADLMLYLKSLAQPNIARALMKSGDIASAQNTLAAALKGTNQIRAAEERSETQTDLAVVAIEVRVKAGDIAGARNTVATALETADQIQDAAEKSDAQLNIAEAQVVAGDIAGAQNTLAAALETADQIQGNSKSDHQVSIALAPPVVSVITAADWVAKLDNPAGLNSDPFIDLAGYLRAGAKRGEPQILLNWMEFAADAIVKAQNLIDGMLKQQAKQQARP